MLDVIIVGSGLSGICMAFNLKRENIDNFVILEKESNVGGTWYLNSYPGAQCDVESHLYSYSFYPKSDWTKVFSDSSEIHSYCLSTVRTFNLENHIKLQTEVLEAKYNENEQTWRVETNQGVLETKYLVMSYAPLHYCNVPERFRVFKGPIIHTSSWDHTYDFTNKVIGVIGTAASGVQVIPELAKRAKQLHVFQRTPNWVLPKLNRSYTSVEKTLFHIKIIQSIYRYSIGIMRELTFGIFRKNSLMGSLAQFVSKWYISLSCPSLYKQLVPSYPIGCKRILLSDNYYQTLNLPHVHLHTEPLSIEENKINGVELDALVLATGFDLKGAPLKCKIIGSSDNVLTEEFYSKTLYGVLVQDFPNMFLLLGPNSGSGHTSIIGYIEAQCEMATRLLKQRPNQLIEVKSKTVQEYQLELTHRFRKFVWNSCQSWYLTNNQNTSLYPGTLNQYINRLKKFTALDL